MNVDMKLRELRLDDAERMLEWMHDDSVVGELDTDFASKTIEDCKDFIIHSNNINNLHLAIADAEDRYMGTVSLKNINKGSAEFAITICKDAMGQGYSLWAMKEILRLGFERYGLDEIFWYVSRKNLRALKFYDKNGYKRVKKQEIKNLSYRMKSSKDSYVWYLVCDHV